MSSLLDVEFRINWLSKVGTPQLNWSQAKAMITLDTEHFTMEKMIRDKLCIFLGQILVAQSKENT